MLTRPSAQQPSDIVSVESILIDSLKVSLPIARMEVQTAEGPFSSFLPGCNTSHLTVLQHSALILVFHGLTLSSTPRSLCTDLPIP